MAHCGAQNNQKKASVPKFDIASPHTMVFVVYGCRQLAKLTIPAESSFKKLAHDYSPETLGCIHSSHGITIRYSVRGPRIR